MRGCKPMPKKLVALTVLAFSVSLAFGQGRRMSRDLQVTNSSIPVDVIVQFQHVPTQLQRQRVFSRGGTLRREMKFIKAGAFRMPANAVSALAQDPEVAYISPDRP